MRFTYLAASLTALSTTSLAPVDAATCKALSDTSNTFFTKLVDAGASSASELASMNLRDTFGPMETLMPWATTCIAAIDPVDAMVKAMSNSKYAECTTAMESYSVYELSDAVIRNTICPAIKDALIPCTQGLAVATLMDAMALTGGCCDAMTAKISESFGTDLATMTETLLQRIGNMICDVKTYTNAAGAESTMSCGFAMAAGISNDVDEEMMLANALGMAQIPNDQVCSAMAGKEYKTTTGAATQFPWTGVAPIGICYEPMSELIAEIANYPMVDTMTTTIGSTTIALANLFADGTCLKLQDVLTWFVDPDSFPTTYMGLALPMLLGEEGSMMSSTEYIQHLAMNETMGMRAMCFHLANGQECTYSTESRETAFAVASSSPMRLAPSLASMSVVATVALVAGWIFAG